MVYALERTKVQNRMKGKLDLNNEIVPFNDANFSLFEGNLAPVNFVLNLLTFPDFLISA